MRITLRTHPRPGTLNRWRRASGAAVAITTLLISTACVSAESRDDAAAAGYPQRPITVLVGFSAGSATDILARKLLDQVEKDTDWSFVVENQDGASGSVALGTLTSQSDDGYTFLFSGGSLAFTASDDITSGSIEATKVVARQATALAAPAGKYADLDDLLTNAQEESITLGLPGALNYNTADMHALAEDANLDLRWVPYEGGSDLAAALLGNQIDAAAASPVNFLAGFESKDLDVLAVTGDQAPPGMPEVPTFEELGYDIPASQWYAFAARAGAPSEIVDKVSEQVDEAMASPEIRDYMEQQGLEPVDMNAEASQDFMQTEASKASKLTPALTKLFEN